MKLLLLVFLSFSSVFLTAQWQLAYEHDNDGKPLRGSKEALFAAVRSGAEVRVGWVESHPRKTSEFFEHFATAQSVIIARNGELYAELPEVGSYNHGRRNTVVVWDDERRIPIVSTLGEVEFKAVGDAGLLRRSRLQTKVKWFVRK